MTGGPARLWLALGAASGFVGVAAGAFGAHGLAALVNAEALAWFETGARYQMYHALALLAVAWLAARTPSARAVAVAGWAFAAGTLLFSGSLYGLAVTGARGFAYATPFGGVAFLVGWAALVVAALSRARTP